jgi:hypothetical protein
MARQRLKLARATQPGATPDERHEQLHLIKLTLTSLIGDGDDEARAEYESTLEQLIAEDAALDQLMRDEIAVIHDATARRWKDLDSDAVPWARRNVPWSWLGSDPFVLSAGVRVMYDTGPRVVAAGDTDAA